MRHGIVALNEVTKPVLPGPLQPMSAHGRPAHASPTQLLTLQADDVFHAMSSNGCTSRRSTVEAAWSAAAAGKTAVRAWGHTRGKKIRFMLAP